MLCRRRLGRLQKSAEEHDLRSGLCGGCVLFQFCRSQRCVSLSSCESEILALASVTSEGALIQRAVEFLTGVSCNLTSRSDSSSARSLAQRLGVGRVRHLSSKILWLQAMVKAQQLILAPVPTEVNCSDVGTKALSEKRILAMANMLGVVDPRHTCGEHRVCRVQIKGRQEKGG